MNGSIPVIEPDVLIDRIAQMSKKADEAIPEDPIGLEARINKIRILLLAFPTSSATYEARRERVVRTQNELLNLAAYGGENQALSFAETFCKMYLELIPSDKRLIEYRNRLLDEV